MTMNINILLNGGIDTKLNQKHVNLVFIFSFKLIFCKSNGNYKP